MRPARQNPDGGPGRQPQRRDGRRGDGVRGQSQLEVTNIPETSVRPERSRGGVEYLMVSRLRSTRTGLGLAAALFLGGCRTAPTRPPPPYHAVGTEPFWHLLIDE